ncbi:MAG: Hsp20/alpha crystallin family protein [Candidatus Methanoperedens sp.]
MKENAKLKEEMGLKDLKVPGFADDLWNFLKLLEEMENKKEKARTVFGKLEGPFDSKAAYGYTVKIGIEGNDFPFNRGFHPRARPQSHVRSIRSENVAEKPMIDVFVEGDGISIVAQMPSVKEEDIDLKIIHNVLRITARTPQGEIKRDISVSDESDIKDASFNNGILTVKLATINETVR